MSFPRYEEYKDSGVELVGEVPKHWDIWKLAHAFTQIGSGTTPKSDNADYYEDGTIPWVNTGDLNDGPLTKCAKCITEKAAEEHSTLKLYPTGSLLFAMYGATIGKLGMLKFPATVNQACCVFSGDSPVSVSFLFYWFLGLRQKILSLATGGGQPNVSQDILRTLRVACPSKDEQFAIASFLDRETAKIDALVAEQRRLVELLKEKRQAVISHAVTKGLDPTVPMKPSGIEWLGDVPQHWEVAPLKYLADIKTGYAFKSEDFVTEGVPVLRIGDIGTDGAVDFSEAKYLPVNYLGDHEDAMVRQNDIVMAMTGATIGKAATYTLAGPALLNQRVCVFRAFDSSSQRFVWYILQTYYYTEYLAVTAFGGAQPNISDLELVGCPFPIPPLSEQVRIAELLDREIELFSQLQAEAERAISLLQERRTALISAAVTGKIDVWAVALEGARL